MDLIIAVLSVVAFGLATGRSGHVSPASIGLGWFGVVCAAVYLLMRLSGTAAPRLRRRRSR